MRISMASVTVAALAALSLGTLSFAQAQGVQPKAATETQSDQSVTIRSVQIVNLKDLKPEMRSKVEDFAAKTSEDNLRSLRASLDATPEVLSALKANGLSSSQVVAVDLEDDVLTIFAKTAS